MTVRVTSQNDPTTKVTVMEVEAGEGNGGQHGLCLLLLQHSVLQC